MAKKTKPCGRPTAKDPWGEWDEDSPPCAYLRHPGRTSCRWHWLLNQPISIQVAVAKNRLRDYLDLGLPKITRQKVSPEGERWCSGCQTFVPHFYVQGSRCKACASSAAHGSHVEREYGLPREDYEKLLDWQNGRCYICGQIPRSRRLAVDHDHRTGLVRGLLCSNDEWGCNSTLRRLLNDIEMARRALAYVEQGPLDRMRSGEPAIRSYARPDRSGPPPPPVDLGEWDPFNDKTPVASG